MQKAASRKKLADFVQRNPRKRKRRIRGRWKKRRKKTRTMV